MAHVHGYPDNEQEHLDDLLGRGKGDPDVYGYPEEKESASTPILFNHDFSGEPVGYLIEGKIKLLRESGVTVEKLANIGIGYIPTKVVDGVVVEAELQEISLIVTDEDTNSEGVLLDI